MKSGIWPMTVLHQDIRRCHRLQDARVLQLLDGLADVVSCAAGRPTRADWIEEVPLVEVQRGHLQQRKLRIREGGIGIVEEFVLSHGS